MNILKSWKRGTILVCLVLGFLALVASASAATVPTFGKKVFPDDGSGWIQPSERWPIKASVWNSGDADVISEASFKISAPNSGTGTRTKLWVLYGKTMWLNGGKRFPLAKIRTTVMFTLTKAAYVEKIWSYNFDAYFNICVKGSKEVWAEGGYGYCKVYHAGRIDGVQKSKIVKNYPRPRVVSTTTEWADPICTPGTTNVDTSQLMVNISQVCQKDQVENRQGADGSLSPVVSCGWWGYPQDTTITAKIPQIAGGMKVVKSFLRNCDPGINGPGWVNISSEPLPGPTVTVTNISPVAYDPISITEYVTITGTVTNNYRGSCDLQVSVTNLDGLPVIVGFVIVGPLTTEIWTEIWITSRWTNSQTNPIRYPSINGTPTTTATITPRNYGFYSC